MKRFNYIMFDGFEENGEYISPQQVTKLLNELYEENQSLKEENKKLREDNKELEDFRYMIFKRMDELCAHDLNGTIRQ